MVVNTSIVFTIVIIGGNVCVAAYYNNMLCNTAYTPNVMAAIAAIFNYPVICKTQLGVTYNTHKNHYINGRWFTQAQARKVGNKQWQ